MVHFTTEFFYFNRPGLRWEPEIVSTSCQIQTWSPSSLWQGQWMFLCGCFDLVALYVFWAEFITNLDNKLILANFFLCLGRKQSSLTQLGLALLHSWGWLSCTLSSTRWSTSTPLWLTNCCQPTAVVSGSVTMPLLWTHRGHSSFTPMASFLPVSRKGSHLQPREGVWMFSCKTSKHSCPPSCVMN